MTATPRFQMVRLFILASVVTLALVAPRSQASGATSPAFTVTGSITELDSPSIYSSPDVHQIDDSKVPLQLTSARYFAIAGTWVKDHYEFPFRVVSAAGVRVGGMDLASNTHTHTRLMEVGLLASAPAATGDPNLRLAIPESGGGSAAYLNLRWHDPFNITLVEVYDDLGWTWDGNYVTGDSEAFPPTSLFPDGWYIGYEYTYSGHTSSTAYAGTVGMYANPVFCAATGGATYIYADPSEADGYINGGRGAYVDSWATGGCNSLLGGYWYWS